MGGVEHIKIRFLQEFPDVATVTNFPLLAPTFSLCDKRSLTVTNYPSMTNFSQLSWKMKKSG